MSTHLPGTTDATNAQRHSTRHGLVRHDVARRARRFLTTSAAAALALLGACTNDAPSAPEQPVPDNRPVASITFGEPATQLSLGSIRRLVPTLRDADGHVLPDRPLEWSSADETVLRVSPAGRLTAIAPGQVQVTARAGVVSAAIAVTVRSAVGGTRYAVSAVDGRALPTIIETERLDLGGGRVVDLLTRLESGLVHLEDDYEVALQLVVIEREIINGRVEHREVGRLIEYDSGRASWNFLDATAVLKSTRVGNLQHTVASDNAGQRVDYRLSGTATVLRLGLTLPAATAQP